MTRETARTLAAQITALNVPAHVKVSEGVAGDEVVLSYRVEAVLRSTSTGNTAVWSSINADDVTAESVVAALVAEIKSRAAKTRRAIRSERTNGF